MFTMLCVTVASWPNAAQAQGQQADGDCFGGCSGDEFFPQIRQEIGQVLCAPTNTVKYVGMAIAVTLAIWCAMRAARGDESRWSRVLLYLLIAGILVDFGSLLNLLSLNWLNSILSSFYQC